uniref:Uncharacterized protein n=1 Tax=Anguilla anguilla TaxID=7936 RepID=A0A0E9QR39_ANGAN
MFVFSYIGHGFCVPLVMYSVFFHLNMHVFIVKEYTSVPLSENNVTFKTSIFITH